MSRRHKDLPSISTQEIRQVAEETSKHALDCIVGNHSIIKKGISRNYTKSIITILAEKYINEKIAAAVSKNVESTLLSEFAKYVDIIDDPTYTVIKTNKAGPPKIEELFSRFRDYDVLTMLKQTYEDVYNKAIIEAADLLDHAMCFLFAMCQMENVSFDRKLRHYHKLLSKRFAGAKVKTERTLQNMVSKYHRLAKKLSDPKAIFKNAKEKLRETSLYRKWMGLKDMYYEKLLVIAPMYAQY